MTDVVNRAFLFALKTHGGQTRKDGKPYLAHPVSVAFELAKNGGSDTLISAGLLHDTIEDGGVLPGELEKEFGEDVLRLILFDTEDKSLSWSARKQATLSALGGSDRDCAMLVCADKLSNLRDMAEGLESEGESFWGRFKYGRKEQAWLYRAYVGVLAGLADLKMYQDLKQLVETIFGKGE